MEGAWVPICNSGLSSGAAAVICKSMGFSGAAGSAKCSGDLSSLHPCSLSARLRAPKALSMAMCASSCPARLSCPHPGLLTLLARAPSTVGPSIIIIIIISYLRWPGRACGGVAPGVSELACSGAESGPLACPHEAGDDVFCAPSESVVVTCAGDGDSQGRPAKESAPQLSA